MLPVWIRPAPTRARVVRTRPAPCRNGRARFGASESSWPSAGACAGVEPSLREPSLAGAPGSNPIMRDADLAARIAALGDGPDGSLGREYI
jgi:hypothetical protein